MVFRTIFWLIKWTFIIGFFVLLIQFWLRNKTYLFSEESVATVARLYAGNTNVQASFNKIYEEFYSKYPGHILPKEDLQWIFVNAGGWMGSMCLLHASLTEYILFFGTPVDTAGHSGRYWANISDTLISGQFKQWKEGSLQINTYGPGDTVLHVWGEATSVNFAANTWMVEYGRGFIPSTMAFALADTIFSTQDFVTMYYTFRIYVKAMILETSIYFTQGWGWIVDHI